MVSMTAEQGSRERAAGWFVEAVRRVRGDRVTARRLSLTVLSPDDEVDGEAVAAVAADALSRLVATAVRHKGWTPIDLREIVRRRAAAGDVALLVDLVIVETATHPDDRVAAAWRQEVETLDTLRPPDLRTPAGLASALRLASALDHLPVLPTTVPAPGSVGSGGSAPVDGFLAAGSPSDGHAAEGYAAGGHAPGGHAPDAERHARRVRALLAKAESTDHGDEAEALSAKAQELISRYALDRLLSGTTPAGTIARRVWIDAPHVAPKATILDQVARANGCRSALSEACGFATLVGATADVEAVTVLNRSLSVQAESAARAHGARRDSDGTVRTRSFRRSFLLSYAYRVGERLAAASRDAASADPRAAELVPVLSARDRAAEEALATLFGPLRSRATSVRSADGWMAGRAAADAASFTGRTEIGATPR